MALVTFFAVRNAAAPLETAMEPPIKEAVTRLNESPEPDRTVVIGLHQDRPRDDVVLFYLNQIEGTIRRASPLQARAYLTKDRFEGLVILPDEDREPRATKQTETLDRVAGCLFIRKIR